MRAEEREVKTNYSDAIPFYYYELAHLQFNNCEDDFTQANQVKSVLEDIQETRKDKLLRLLREIEPETPVKFLSKAGAQELNAVRPAL